MVSDDRAELDAAKSRLSAALKAWNGTPAADLPQAPGREEVAAILARLDAEDAAAEQAAEREPIIAALGRLEARLGELAEQGKPKLTRSGMSAMEKSRYIREHGKAKYDSIPWLADVARPGAREQQQ